MAVSEVNPAKKQKIVDSEDESDKMASFKGFEIVKILNENAKQKCVFLQGRFANKTGNAVVLLEKSPFDREHVGQILSKNTDLVETLQNDIYSTYSAYPPVDLNPLKTTVIYPATAKHIAKYSDQESYILRETQEMYEEITLPTIQKHNLSIQWVYNILEKKTEADRIIYEDPDKEVGFILLPDMKWNRKDTDALYLQAIVMQRNIKSLRDLDQTHIKLLKNILNKGLANIKEHFGVPETKLRIYLHYQPSYYHLHVHFTHVKLENPGFDADRAHLLTSVIENIEAYANFYQERSLTFKVRENDILYLKYKEVGFFE
ncbi:hypothetical protein ScPMuIL_008869 [Solemya velum]